MKKGFITILLLLFCFSSSFAQQLKKDSLSDSYSQEFLLNAASFAVGGFEIGYGSISNSRNKRLFLGYYFMENPEFYNAEEFPVTTTHRNMEGFRAEFQYLFMKPTDAQKRFYGGGYALFKTINMDITKQATAGNTTTTLDYTANATAAGVGVIGGIRVYMIDNFFADLFIGGGIIIPVSSNNIDDVHLDVRNPYKRSINPRAGISFGIAF